MSEPRLAYVCLCNVAYLDGGRCEKCGVERSLAGQVIGPAHNQYIKVMVTERPAYPIPWVPELDAFDDYIFSSEDAAAHEDE